MAEFRANYDIGGLGPHSNSTYGYFQYLVADEITIDNECYLNKATILNNHLVKGVVKTTNVQIGTFADPTDIYDSTFTATYDLNSLRSDLQQAQSDISTLQSQVSALQSDSHTH